MSTPNTIPCTPNDAKTKQTPCFDAHAPVVEIPKRPHA